MVFKKMATSSKRSRSDCGLVAPLGWFSDEESDEEASKKHSKKNERFSFKSTTEIESLSTVKPPKTTSYATACAVRNFEAWKSNRNVAFPDKQVPANLLQSGSSKDLGHWLLFFCVRDKKLQWGMLPTEDFVSTLKWSCSSRPLVK